MSIFRSCVMTAVPQKLGFQIAQRTRRVNHAAPGIQHGFSRSALHIQRKVLILQP